MSFAATSLVGAPAGPASAAGSAGNPVTHQDFTISSNRSFTMFQALYADLARAQRKRRQREFQRQLEQRAQREMLQALPRLLLR